MSVVPSLQIDARIATIPRRILARIRIFAVAHALSLLLASYGYVETASLLFQPLLELFQDLWRQFRIGLHRNYSLSQSHKDLCSLTPPTNAIAPTYAQAWTLQPWIARPACHQSSAT